MIDLNDFIYSVNLVSTGAIRDVEDLNSDLNINLNYKDCVSLIDIVRAFNDEAVKYNEDLKKLPKLNLGNQVTLLGVLSDNDYLKLMFYIDSPIKGLCDDESTFLYVIMNEGKISSYISNNLGYFNKNYYRRNIKINEEIIKKYLDFADKYKCFIKYRNSLLNTRLVGLDNINVYSKINGDLLNGINSFEVSLGRLFLNYEDYVNVKFIICDEIIVDYDNSIVKINNDKIDNKKEYIDLIINNIYIHLRNIPLLSDVKEKENIKKLTL